MAKRNKRPRARRLERTEPDFRSVRLTAKAVGGMTMALEAQHRLHFAVKWATQRPLVLMSLQIKVPPDNLFVELLTNPLSSNNGEIVFDMGMFSAGDATIRFQIGALAAIPRVATFVVEDEQKVTPFKPAAGQPSKALQQGERWRESASYTVGAPQ